MQDFESLADLLQRFQRLNRTVNSRCSTYNDATLTAMRENLGRMERGVQQLRQQLVRRGEVMGAGKNKAQAN